MAQDVEQIAKAFIDGFPRLDADEQRLALSVYRLLGTGRPVSPGAVAEAAGWTMARVLERLEAWPAVFRDDDGLVVGFWGMAVAEVTSHRVDLDDDTTVWTWCAYDTLFIPQLLGVTAQVSSRCPTTGSPVRLTVSPDGVVAVDPAAAVVSLLRPDKPIDDNVRQSLCHFVHFFVSPEAADTWMADHPGTFRVTVRDAFAVAQRQNAAVYSAVLKTAPSSGA